LDTPKPDPVKRNNIKHDHGHLFRAKITPFGGAPEYGEWFHSESALRAAMKDVIRALGKRYYCEAKAITCAECDANENPRVIATL